MGRKNKKARSPRGLQVVTLCISTMLVLVLLGMVVFSILTARNLSTYVKENLTVTYVGEETIKLRDKSTHNSHHVTFKFTQDGKKKSSDDIHCWISTDNAHIPLMIKGSVSVGEVRVYYKAPTAN